jgi:hypothetical protein
MTKPYTGDAKVGQEGFAMDDKPKCPLCSTTAIYAETSRGKKFRCSVCTEFFIDSHAEREIREAPEVTRSEFRAQLSQLARESGPDLILVIREPRSDESNRSTDGKTSTTVIAEQVRRSP